MDRLRVMEAGAALVVGFLVLAPVVMLLWPSQGEAGATSDPEAQACAKHAEEPLAKKPKPPREPDRGGEDDGERDEDHADGTAGPTRPPALSTTSTPPAAVPPAALGC